jgi:predicted nucleic acid-binding protein
MALPPRLFCDTSFFYACLDPADANHGRAKAIVEEAADVGATFLTTWDIISETVTLLHYRKGFRAAVTFLTEIKPRLRIVTYGDRVRNEANKSSGNMDEITDSPSVTRSLSWWSRRCSTTFPAWPLTKIFAASA